MRRFRVGCKRGHSRLLTATELESVIREWDVECQQCNGQVDLLEPSEIALECRICSDVFEESSLEAALHAIEGDCPSCARRGFNDDSIHVPGSWQSLEGSYEWMQSGKEDEPLRRPGRTDYCEGVIHFCSAVEFAQIQEAGRIKSFPTGFFHVPAVCLSETTEGGWNELRKLHGDFGYVFHKRDLLSIGGGPAVYLNPDVLAAQMRTGFAEEAKPFVNVLRTHANAPDKRCYDYLHEREWRTPRDIVFRVTEPYAVITGKVDVSTPGWDHIFAALMSYEELNIDQES
jgi:hypothetical protein